jgi:hypothetical protein
MTGDSVGVAFSCGSAGVKPAETFSKGLVASSTTNAVSSRQLAVDSWQGVGKNIVAFLIDD